MEEIAKPYEANFDVLERKYVKSVADPGFSRGGAPTYYLENFADNCMKMKEI